MLIDFDEDPVIYLYKQGSSQTDSLGMSVNAAVGGTPFAGRISGISSQQILAWGTLGFQADCDLFCNDGTLDDGDVVRDDAGVWYRVLGKARRVHKGNIHTFFKYPLKSQSLSGTPPDGSV